MKKMKELGKLCNQTPEVVFVDLEKERHTGHSQPKAT
jgi:hypothetical protein